MKLDVALPTASDTLRAMREEIKGQLADCEGVALSMGVSSRPQRIPLQFSSPYAYCGAYLIAELDGLVAGHPQRPTLCIDQYRRVAPAVVVGGAHRAANLVVRHELPAAGGNPRRLFYAE